MTAELSKMTPDFCANSLENMLKRHDVGILRNQYKSKVRFQFLGLGAENKNSDTH